MPGEGINSINWDRLWQEQMEAASFKGEGREFWDGMAHRLERKKDLKDAYLEEFLKRIDLSNCESLLDVGCGTGAVALPLAKRVRTVTALDLSPVMLQYLAAEIAARAIGNVSLKQADFPHISPAELGTHDVVIASRSLPMGNLRQSLTRIHEAGRKRCYVTWIAERNESDARICRLTGNEYHPFPDYLIMVNMLYTMGITANVEIFSVVDEYCFAGPQEAIQNVTRGRPITAEVREKLNEYFRDLLVFEGGFWRRRMENKWALIWWKK
jgi:SAM-dependent methyltransferase